MPMYEYDVRDATKDRLRKEWSKLMDYDHALRMEYDGDTTLELARYQLARYEFDSWIMVGPVPVGTWNALTGVDKAGIVSAHNDNVAYNIGVVVMTLFAVVAIVGAALASVWLTILAALTSGLALWWLSKHPLSGVYAGMSPPGTVSTLKHAARTYEVANGMLTLATETQGGELTTIETGALEVCDE